VQPPLNTGWSYGGSWSVLWGIADKDGEGNAAIPPGKTCDIILQDTTKSYIYGQSRLITELGIDKLVVADTLDALLTANKDRVQDI